MTPTNAELNGEFNEIRLNIQIEAKITGKQDIWRRKFVLITQNM